MPYKDRKAHNLNQSKCVKIRRDAATVDQQSITAQLDYDPDTGHFYKKSDTKRVRPFGKKRGLCYWVIYVNGRYWPAHRMAWLYVYGRMPIEVVDHINSDTLDNRISNLRECMQSDNVKSARRRYDNTSGIKGVSFCKTYEKWVAHIQCDKKPKFLGYYATKQEAARARRSAALRLFGQFAKDESAEA